MTKETETEFNIINVDLFLQELKKKFPSPVPVDDSFEGNEYCVGGAFCMGVNPTENSGFQYRFPLTSKLISNLEKANKNLSWDKAKEFAQEIIELNDFGKIEEAWSALEKALRFGRS